MPELHVHPTAGQATLGSGLHPPTVRGRDRDLRAPRATPALPRPVDDLACVRVVCNCDCVATVLAFL